MICWILVMAGQTCVDLYTYQLLQYLRLTFFLFNIGVNESNHCFLEWSSLHSPNSRMEIIFKTILWCTPIVARAIKFGHAVNLSKVLVAKRCKVSVNYSLSIIGILESLCALSINQSYPSFYHKCIGCRFHMLWSFFKLNCHLAVDNWSL